MKVVVGLGNPGKQYEKPRHNMGFLVIDQLTDIFSCDLNYEKFKGIYGICKNPVLPEPTIFAKPETFMNLSGEFVRPLLDYFKIGPEDLIVIYDDISLAPGRIRVRQKGSAGGHNGMKSIIGELGTQEFLRVRIGVGEKPEGYDLADYVRGRLPLGERADMETAFDLAGRAAMDLLDHPAQDVMSAYNGN